MEQGFGTLQAVPGVVGHPVDDHAQAERMRAGDECVGVGEGPEGRVHVGVVRMSWPKSATRAVEGRQPDRVDAEAGEVVQARGDTREVADAVAVGVGEGAG